MVVATVVEAGIRPEMVDEDEGEEDRDEEESRGTS